MTHHSEPHPPPGRVRRAGAALASARGVRLLTGLAMALLWLIIPSGAVVRLTGSGLGCRDWPLCENASVIPAMDANAWIEYTNRILSGVVMVVVLATAIVVVASRSSALSTRVAAVLAAIATVGQVPLGAVTVYFDLHPLLVASHFGLSLIALGAGVIAFLGASDTVRGIRRNLSAGAAWLAAAGALALITTMVTGVLTTSAGPHSGDPDVITRYGTLDTAVYWHVRAVILLGIVAIAVAIVGRARRGDRGLLVPALCFIPLFAGQVTIGEVQWNLHLPWAVVVFHVAVAGLAWGVGAAALWRLARPVTSRSARA